MQLREFKIWQFFCCKSRKNLVVKGYTIFNVVSKYIFKKFSFGISIENLLNTAWREAQFETYFRLKNEAQPVTDLNFTSGTPFNLKKMFTYKF